MAASTAMPTAAAAGSAAARLTWLSSACTAVPGAAAWSLAGDGGAAHADDRATGGDVAYAAGPTVAVYHPKSVRVAAVLRGHTGRVNSVAWVHRPRVSEAGVHAAVLGHHRETTLVSGSSDGTVRVWARPTAGGTSADADASIAAWREAAVLKAHEGSVTNVSAIWLPADGSSVIASVSTDGTMCVWTCVGDDTADGWTLQLRLRAPPPQMAECVALGPLPGCFGTARTSMPPGTKAGTSTGVLVATGCVDSKVRLYTLQSSSATGAAGASAASLTLVPAVTLAGHQDWIRSLHFSHAGCPVTAGDGGGGGSHDDTAVLLASSSKDAKVRLWRIATVHADDAAGGSRGASGGGRRETAAEDEPEFLTALRKPQRFTARGIEVALSRGVSGAATVAPSTADGAEFDASLDALLTGHDDWVSCVRWVPPQRRDASSAGAATAGALIQPARVITASMDKTVVLWGPDAPTSAEAEAADAPAHEDGRTGASGAAGFLEAMQMGVWTPLARVGDVGGNTLGFVGCCMSPDGSLMLAHGHHGSLQLWQQRRDVVGASDDAARGGADAAGGAAVNDMEARSMTWAPLVTSGGHFGPVTDLCWGTRGSYLLSVSLDQTCRAFAPWNRDVARVSHLAVAGADVGGRWCLVELARPQVHGYDLNCACLPPVPGVPHRLISGADEKVLRVFDAPRVFTDSLSTTTGCSPSDASCDESGAADTLTRVASAYVPELGLSNKAVFESGEGAPIDDMLALKAGMSHTAGTPALATATLGVDGGSGDGGSGGGGGAASVASNAGGVDTAPLADFAPMAGALGWPPLETDLVQGTLWPEVQKMYGHGNELLCVAADHGGRVIASACKARDDVNAALRLWDARTWRELQVLTAHKLSVIQLEFSPDDRYLLSVSKDRQVCIYTRTSAADGAGAGASAGAGSGAGDGAGDGAPRYAAALCISKAHKRVVWSCSWAPTGRQFATGARDGFVKVWTLEDSDERGDATRIVSASHMALPSFGESVTAVAFGPRAGPSQVLAVGLDSGLISIWSRPTADSSGWSVACDVSAALCPMGAVSRLLWQAPAAIAAAAAADGAASGGSREAAATAVSLVLAAASADQSIRCFDTKLAAV